MLLETVHTYVSEVFMIAVHSQVYIAPTIKKSTPIVPMESEQNIVVVLFMLHFTLIQYPTFHPALDNMIPVPLP